MLASHLQSSQISDITSIEEYQGGFGFQRPIYAGKAFETKRFTQASKCWVLTIRPNNFRPAGNRERFFRGHDRARTPLPS